MSLDRQHSFWGSLSPLGGLSGAGLLIMASARLSWAITTALGLLWVYGLTSFTFTLLLTAADGKILPTSGRAHVFTCIASFFGSAYLLMILLFCPFAAIEVFIPLLLIPLFCTGSGIFEQISAPPENSRLDIFDHVSDAIAQAAVLAVLLVSFSIIREPLSFCSLSFPGTFRGMITIVNFKAGSFFPIGIFATSAGALLLLGYFICLYQYCKSVFFRETLRNE
jgi:hypothetical protein